MKFLQIYGYEKEGPLETSEKLIKYGIAYKNHQKQLEEIITFIVELLGHKMQEIDLKKALDETCKLLYRTVENNIAEKYPELVKEWNIEDNNNRKPEHFTTGSRECIQWKCSKCGYKWKVSIKSRIRFKSGCTKCGFNVFDGKIHTRAIRKPKGNFIFGQYNL